MQLLSNILEQVAGKNKSSTSYDMLGFELSSIRQNIKHTRNFPCSSESSMETYLRNFFFHCYATRVNKSCLKKWMFLSVFLVLWKFCLSLDLWEKLKSIFACSERFVPHSEAEPTVRLLKVDMKCNTRFITYSISVNLMTHIWMA